MPRSARTPTSNAPTVTTRRTSRPSRSRRRPPSTSTGLPAAHVEDTPDTPTIDTLVTVLNERFPRSDRPWWAGDTLKNVVVLLRQPDGSTEPLAIGVPGDREVDPKRLEAQVAPAEIEPFTEEHFAANPGLVKGYIGPGALGAEQATKIRYLLDPRIAPGSAWVTGADQPGRHVIGLVAGRDFTGDGIIQAAEIRDGDECPVCGNALISARGIEMGHIFQLGRKYADALEAEGARRQRQTGHGHHGLVRRRRVPCGGGGCREFP